MLKSGGGMRDRVWIATGTLLAALGLLGLAVSPARASDEATYPDWKGKWQRKSSGNFDPDKPAGLGQQAPLIPEYQRILEASVAEQAAGGQGNNPMAKCIPPGMPRMMIVYGGGMEIVITPPVTYLVFGEPMLQIRRIHTDGRAWPANIKATFSGYSIGTWDDQDHNGLYDTLVVETRALKAPRSYDSSGMPFHKDGQTIVKERIYLDRLNPGMLHDEITTIDNALTRPWTIHRTYQREPATWMETICGEDEHQVTIGNEHYFLSGNGYLMPTRPDQPPPDLRFFNPLGP
jgi:hypothetical protein